MATNKKLGKGLSSLLGNKEDLTINVKEDNGLLLVSIEKIFRDENQPRKEFDPEKINELAQSIKKNGLIQPLILTKRNYDTYTLVAGERRWRAAQTTDLKLLPALLLPEDLDKDEVSLIENIQRDMAVLTDKVNLITGKLERAEGTWEMAENLYEVLADKVRQMEYDIKDLNREINY